MPDPSTSGTPRFTDDHRKELHDLGLTDAQVDALEATPLAGTEGADVLRGRAFETSGRRLPYQPMTDALRAWLERDPRGDRAHARPDGGDRGRARRALDSGADRGRPLDPVRRQPVPARPASHPLQHVRGQPIHRLGLLGTPRGRGGEIEPGQRFGIGVARRGAFGGHDGVAGHRWDDDVEQQHPHGHS